MNQNQTESKPQGVKEPRKEGLDETACCASSMEIPRRPVPGWQWVKCDDCGTTWKESNRDVISPSHVDCPNHCDHGGDTHVWKYERDEMLARDTSGNLLNPEVVILTRGLGHNMNYPDQNSR